MNEYGDWVPLHIHLAAWVLFAASIILAIHMVVLFAMKALTR